MSDDWDFYFCDVDHKPASIFLDLGIRQSVPLPGLQYLAWLRLHMQAPGEDGLSSKEEYETLIQLEHALERDLATHSERILFVGRNTSGGMRDFYFYTDNGSWAEMVLSTTMVQFPAYEFETSSRHDAGWEAYVGFLYPSERDMQTIKNDRVLSALERNGDRHDVVREISHWAYFETAEARDRFSSDVRSRGYREVSRCDNAGGSRQFGVTVASDSDVQYKTINKITLELFDIAKESSGEYDGWETSVEHEPPDGGS